MTDSLFDPFEAMKVGLSDDAQATMTVWAQEVALLARDLLPRYTGYSLRWEVKPLRWYVAHDEMLGQWWFTCIFRVSPFRAAERMVFATRPAPQVSDNPTVFYTHKLSIGFGMADLYFEEMVAQKPTKHAREVREQLMVHLASLVLEAYTPIMHTSPADRQVADE